MGSPSPRRPTAHAASAGPLSICSACRRRRKRLTPFLPTHPRTPTRSWSTGCWPRRTTASAGAATGSTWPATPTRTATAAPTRSAPTPTNTAITSSAPSTPTSRSTSSFSEQLAGDEMVPPPYRESERRRHRQADRDRLPAHGSRRHRLRRRRSTGGAQPGNRRHAQDRFDIAAGVDRRLRPVP